MTLFHTQAEVIVKLLDKLNIKNFQLFGNSLGGGLCIEIAELSPTRVEKLILRVPFISYKQLPLPARTSVLKSAFSYLVSKSTIQRALRPTIRSLLIRELFPEGSLYRNFKSEVLDELDKRADSKLSTAYITEAFYLDYESILNSLYMPITILETPVDNVLSKNYSSLLIDSISRILIPNSQHGLLSLDQKMLATMITKILKN